MQYVFNDLTFNSQSQAKKWFSNLLHSAIIGKHFEDDDHKRLYALLERHPDSKIKIGCGVKWLYVNYAPNCDFKSKCFWILRVDGSKTDFSYIACIRAKNTTPMDDFYIAAREAVIDSARNFKQNYFNGEQEARCAETGVMLKYEIAHVDHKPPWLFHKICKEFLKKYELTPNYSWISAPLDEQAHAVFANATIRANFIAFHDSLAELQVISPEQNQKHGSKESRE